MATLYSTRFLAVELAVGEEATFTVGEGLVAVVRDIDILTTGTAGGAVYVQGPTGVTFCFAVQPTSDAALFSWRGRQVFLAGETVTVVCESDTAQVTISGYALTAP